MKWLLALILYQSVSGRLLWSHSKLNTAENDDLNNMFSNLLDNMHLDISFAPNTKSFSNLNNDYNSNYYMDESPSSSMFTFPSIFGDKLQSPIHIRSKWSNPLYLMVDSNNNNSPNPSSSTYSLTKSNKVNGNTWRYTVNTDKNGKEITKSWSTQKMYLCNSVSCTDQNGMEMKSINKYSNYMHLVPTSTTMEPMGTDYEDIGDEEDDDDIDGFHIDLHGLMDIASNMLNVGKTRTDDDGDNDDDISSLMQQLNKARDLFYRSINKRNDDMKGTMDENEDVEDAMYRKDAYKSKGLINLDGLMNKISEWWPMGDNVYDADDYNVDTNYQYDTDYDHVDDKEEEKKDDISGKGINLNGLLDTFSSFWSKNTNNYDDDTDTNGVDVENDGDYMYENEEDENVDNEQNEDVDDKEEEENDDISGKAMSLNGLLDTFSSFWSKHTNYDDDTDTNGIDVEDVGDYMHENEEDETVDNEQNEENEQNEAVDDKNDENEEDVVENEEDKAELDGFMENDNNNRLLSNGDTDTESLGYEEKHDLLFIEMTVIIIFIMFCGVLYGAWRFLLDRREKQRENEYYNINVSNGL